MDTKRWTTGLGVSLVAALMIAAAPPPTTSMGVFETGAEADRECDTLTSLVPTHPIAADHLVGDELRLRVHVLMDVPTSRRTAVGSLLRQAADEVYLDGTRVQVSFTWRARDIGGDELATDDAFAIAKAATRGRPPSGADVVYLVTDNDLVSSATGSNSVAGQADCVGGIMDPSQAYAIGEMYSYDFEDHSIDLRGWASVNALHNITGKIFAHELGHLLGAHHHYSTCGDAVTERPTSDLFGVCSLMINDIGLASLQLSVTNSAVTRGHAAAWGNANRHHRVQ